MQVQFHLDKPCVFNAIMALKPLFPQEGVSLLARFHMMAHFNSSIGSLSEPMAHLQILWVDFEICLLQVIESPDPELQTVPWNCAQATGFNIPGRKHLVSETVVQ